MSWDDLPYLLDDLLDELQQQEESGGINNPPELRLLLCLLAQMTRAKRIIETGYDAGYTTMALALTGAKVLAVDDLSGYPGVEAGARERLHGISNVSLFNTDALEFLRVQPDESADLIFVDDDHSPAHVARECTEIRRILRPGGMAAFHDVNVGDLWQVINRAFSGWMRIYLPAYQPGSDLDYGVGIVRKPPKERVIL